MRAAVEVDRLRAELDNAKTVIRQVNEALLDSKYKAHRDAEKIARLREALEAVESEIALEGHLQEIVSAALAPRPPEGKGE